ncbi:MAG: hypothetical protein U0414_31075 [Polyangiaceae bacterium]
MPRCIAIAALIAVLSACGGASEPGPSAIPTADLASASAVASPPPKRAPSLCNGDACQVACERDHDALACTRRAKELQSNMHDPRDAEIVALFSRGCADRDPEACMELAVACGRDMDIEGCRTAGLEALPVAARSACTAGQSSTCEDDARAALFVRGYALAEAGCEGRAPRACFLVAYGNEVGYGRDPDLPAALRWYRRGCAAGDAASCDSLAVVLRREADWAAPGEVPEADAADARALDLRADACDAGDAMECVALARMYKDGAFPAGIDKEKAEAARARACKLGHEASCR